MNIADHFLNKFNEITTMTPVPGKLAIGKNGGLYWLYYAGMGETSYHEMTDKEQKIAKELIKQKVLFISADAQSLPVFDDKGLAGEIFFKIIRKL